ncbi:pre-piRNA 3'-exonuclease trimmer-like isoform X2 [Trichoplusia ni]|uniref:Pre-piRNA 3'-exonuclease trimmer-like isoform X2 n=1 Tax=Trichoplusia ni TaxID=7111 RepID=A0A7E5V8Q1_TRINI|nr:pre-piRNA 3'-exonuclease trimmer-like isoform X2 [Trichoplusia ni]
MEVTRKNFIEELENVKRDLSKCCFVGFDAEFTALLTGECFKHRLFDTSEDRYNKIKNEVSNMIMTQVGLTMFEYDRDTDSYTATGYTFHLCPQVVADIDQSFIFQASTLNFLCQHKFDFNKFTYEGLPYLSKVEAVKVQTYLENGLLLKDHARTLSMDEERQLQQYCSQVSKWLIQNEEDTIYLDVESPVLRYLTHMEIRSRFPKVLTTDSLGNSKKVLVYRHESVAGANNAPESQLQENLMKHLLGFSQVIALLETSKKPIVGHNIFLDTILLHNQFIGPLPQEYTKFKQNIHKTFPFLFDTKYISYEMSRKLSYREVWKSNNLQDLYEFFSEGKCKQLRKGVNHIKLSREFKDNQTYHEAGWDSYCSGYCFVRLGHWIASENRGSYTTVGPTETLTALAPYCNKINVIRGAITYMSFAENDPPRHRPPLLHVKALAQRTINIGQVASALAGFGNIDVKPHGRRTALVAAVTHQTRVLSIVRQNLQ